MIPLWFDADLHVYSENVDNVSYDPFQQILLTDVTVN